MLAYLQGTSSWDDTVRLSKESSPVVKVFSAAAACLATMGGLAVNYIVWRVDMKMDEFSKELKKEIAEYRKEFAENTEEFKKQIAENHKELKKELKEVASEIRYIALVMTERLAIVEAKLGVPNGKPLLPPQKE